jgi:tetratricopeptide (TPR) repeat protein
MSPGIEQKLWLRQATEEIPYYREAWVELSQWYYDRGYWSKGLEAAEKAISIEDGEHSLAYQREAFAWGERAYDLAAICAHRMGRNDLALDYGTTAHELAPENERLKNNLAFYV